MTEVTSHTMEATYWRAPRSPRWEVLRHRLSPPDDHALVLRDEHHGHHVLWHQQRTQERGDSGGSRPGDAAEWTPRPRAYVDAFHVDVTRREGTMAIRLPHQYGPPEPVTLRVVWWVHDPIQVVRSSTAYGWTAVRHDLEGHLRDLEKQQAVEGRYVDVGAVAHRVAAPFLLDHRGITYQVTEVFPQEGSEELLLSGQGSGDSPHTWSPTRRDEYDFCLQAVRNGPVSLAALWLMRRPDQVREVLDWSVGHRGLIREESGWQDQMTGLLSVLSEEERMEISEVLKERLLALGRRVPRDGETPQWPG